MGAGIEAHSFTLVYSGLMLLLFMRLASYILLYACVGCCLSTC